MGSKDSKSRLKGEHAKAAVSKRRPPSWLEEGKRLLAETKDTIDDIADRLHTVSSNFQVQFKKHTGMTPGAYRKQKMSDDVISTTKADVKLYERFETFCGHLARHKKNDERKTSIAAYEKLMGLGQGKLSYIVKKVTGLSAGQFIKKYFEGNYELNKRGVPVKFIPSQVNDEPAP